MRDHRAEGVRLVDAGGNSAKGEGVRLVYGGNAPTDGILTDRCCVEATVFADVAQEMRIAREEIFGPVQPVFRWEDEEQMLRDVNSVEFGLTASIYANDLETAHRTAAGVEAGYIWVNGSSRHTLGAPFGG